MESGEIYRSKGIQTMVDKGNRMGLINWNKFLVQPKWKQEETGDGKDLLKWWDIFRVKNQ